MKITQRMGDEWRWQSMNGHTTLTLDLTTIIHNTTLFCFFCILIKHPAALFQCFSCVKSCLSRTLFFWKKTLKFSSHFPIPKISGKSIKSRGSPFSTRNHKKDVFATSKPVFVELVWVQLCILLSGSLCVMASFADSISLFQYFCSAHIFRLQV